MLRNKWAHCYQLNIYYDSNDRHIKCELEGNLKLFTVVQIKYYQTLIIIFCFNQFMIYMLLSGMAKLFLEFLALKQKPVVAQKCFKYYLIHSTTRLRPANRWVIFRRPIVRTLIFSLNVTRT